MNKEIFKYLKAYSFEPFVVNRLIVSNFIYSNNLQYTKNIELLSYLIKNDSDDFKALEEFIGIQKLTTIENLIEVFEFVISPMEKVVTGAIYTPSNIRHYIINEVLKEAEDLSSINICDPACGCAAFLFSATKFIREKTSHSFEHIFKQNLFGLDIQKYSVKRSELILSLYALKEGEDVECFDFNIHIGNALNFDWNLKINEFKGFDFIVGNPPYVCSRNIDEESKELLKNWNVCSTGHPDLYIPFFEIGFSILKDEGSLGYITMNTFFKSINGRALRGFFQKKEPQFKIIDFGSEKIFNSKSTYTCICLIKKVDKSSLMYTRVNSNTLLKKEALSFSVIEYSTLDSFNGWNLQNPDIINKIESIGIPLGEKFKTRNGIATLKNNIYIFSPVSEDDHFYYLQNGSIYPIEKDICSDIINPNKLKKKGITNKIRQKAIFPYNRESSSINLIDEFFFKKNYPEAYKYLEIKKTILATRDKGKGKYEKWYAYGRNQSLEKMAFKLFFPHISASIPNYVINQDESLLFYNGLALIGKNKKELLFMKKIMSSRLFWFYITKSSKPYGSEYFSLSRTYIKNFGIYDFSDEEVNYLIKEKNQLVIDTFIESKYNIQLS